MNLLTVWKTPLKNQPHKMVIKNWNLILYNIRRVRNKFIINPFQKNPFKKILLVFGSADIIFVLILL